MAREKRKKNKYRIESIDPPGTYRGGSSLHMFSTLKKGSQISPDQFEKSDSLYKTIVATPSQTIHHKATSN